MEKEISEAEKEQWKALTELLIINKQIYNSLVGD